MYPFDAVTVDRPGSRWSSVRRGFGAQRLPRARLLWGPSSQSRRTRSSQAPAGTCTAQAPLRPRDGILHLMLTLILSVRSASCSGETCRRVGVLWSSPSDGRQQLFPCQVHPQPWTVIVKQPFEKEAEILEGCRDGATKKAL